MRELINGSPSVWTRKIVLLQILVTIMSVPLVWEKEDYKY